MSLSIKSLEASNVFSYENIFLDFCNSPITQLVGVNGVGKTNILNTLCEGLFGKNPRGYKKADIPNNLSGSNNYYIKVCFSVDEDDYEVVTQRNGAKLNLSLLENGMDISEHTAPATYKLIEEIIGMDYALALTILYKNSESSMELLKATEGGRRKYLINLLGINEHAEYITKAREKVKECTDKFIALGDTFSLFSKRITDINKQISDLQLTPLPVVSGEDINGLKRKEHSLSSELMRVREHNATLWTEHTHKLNEANKLLNDYNLKMAKHKDLVNRIDSLSASIVNPPAQPLHPGDGPNRDRFIQLTAINVEINAQCSKVEGNISKLNKELAAHKASAPRSHCHTCHQSLNQETAIEVWKQKLGELEAAILVETSELDELKKELAVSIAEYSDLYKEILAHDAALKQYDEVVKRITKIKDANEIYSKQLEELTSEYRLTIIPAKPEMPNAPILKDESALVAELDSVRAKIKNDELVSNASVIYETKLQMYQDQLELAEKDANEVSQQRKEVEEDLALYSELLVIVTGTMTFFIEASVSALQELTNKYLQVFSGGKFQIQFKVDNDKLSMVLFNNGKETSLYTASKGQETRIAISVLLAIRSLLDTMSKNKLNLLILDECLEVLDNEGKDQLLDILAEEQGMNIFLVSHAWTHPLFNKVELSVDERGYTQIG